MRPDLVENFSSHLNHSVDVHWIVVLSFLGVGLLVGWLLGYHSARRELAEKTSVSGDGE